MTDKPQREMTKQEMPESFWFQWSDDKLYIRRFDRNYFEGAETKYTRASQATKTNCGECERLMAALEEIALDAGDSVHGRNGNLAKEALASCQERK